MDQLVGFAFQSDEWRSTNFEPSKYVFKWGRDTPEDKEAWLLREIGSDSVLSICGDYELDFKVEGGKLIKGWRRGELIRCDSLLFTARLQKKTLRLLIAYTAGFIRGTDAADSNTPFIGIGKCSPL